MSPSREDPRRRRSGYCRRCSRAGLAQPRRGHRRRVRAVRSTLRRDRRRVRAKLVPPKAKPARGTTGSFLEETLPRERAGGRPLPQGMRAPHPQGASPAPRQAPDALRRVRRSCRSLTETPCREGGGCGPLPEGMRAPHPHRATLPPRHAADALRGVYRCAPKTRRAAEAA